VNADRRRPGDELQVDPAPVGRRRSLRPAGLVVAVSVVFIALAVLKPWDAGRTAVASPAAAAVPSPPGSSASAKPVAAALAPFEHPPTPADLIRATVRRSEWGVRAVVVPQGEAPAGDGTGSGLAERFQAIDVSDGADGADLDLGAASTAVKAGDNVIGLGVTTPDDAMPLDVRFWRLEPGAVVRRIVPRPVRGREAGSWLWLPDPHEATLRGTWPAGTYRIDVLLGPRIVRLLTVVPTGVPALPRGVPAVAEPSNLVDQLRSFAAGPFAFTPQVAIPIDVSPHDPMDERLAWLGPATGQSEIAAVGRVTVDPVTAFGLLLKPGEQFVSADLERVAPAAGTPDVQILPLPPIPRSDGGRATAVIFEYADLRPLEAGLYHLTATATMASGEDRTQTWNLEIVPSAAPPPPGVPLVRMARWVSLMNDPVRLATEPVVFDQDLGGDICGSGQFSNLDGLYGIVEPPGTAVSRIRLIALAGQFQPDIVARIAPNVVDGFTLAAVPDGGLLAGDYQLDIDTTSADGPERHVHTVCVGLVQN
jgi:hypothetical protein